MRKLLAIVVVLCLTFMGCAQSVERISEPIVYSASYDELFETVLDSILLASTESLAFSVDVADETNGLIRASYSANASLTLTLTSNVVFRIEQVDSSRASLFYTFSDSSSVRYGPTFIFDVMQRVDAELGRVNN